MGVMLRLHQPLLGAIDQWRERHGVSRPEAVRALTEIALGVIARGQKVRDR